MYNFDSNMDLELFEKKKVFNIESGKEDWRLEPFTTKGIRYWRLAKNSRDKRITKYVGNDKRVREFCATQLGRRKPRKIFIV